MKQKKFLVITKEEISSWKSCQLITGNLLKSYHLAYPEDQFQFLRVEENFSAFLAYKHAKKIKELGVDTIIWLDHRPCAANLVMALSEVYSDTPYELKPKFLIHLFGDFVLDCLSWENAEEAINHYPVHFMVASEKQKKLVDNFFKSQESLTSVLPFPVDEKDYSINCFKNNREEIRNKFNLNDEVVFIYTGRISFQKNVEAIINLTSKLKDIVDKKIEVWVVGPWDDILLPYFGQWGMPGSQFTQFHSSILDKNLSNVRFLGNLESSELLKVYQASDAFISFSTYNDEDYGMSVAEALMTGLPCVLSDWGGFSTFAKYSKQVDLVPVEPRGMRMQVNSQAAQKAMLKKIMQILENEISREDIHGMAQEHLSTSAVAKKIRAINDTCDFKYEVKFSVLFFKLCALFHANKDAPFKNNIEIYNEIYGVYAADRN